MNEQELAKLTERLSQIADEKMAELKGQLGICVVCTHTGVIGDELGLKVNETAWESGESTGIVRPRCYDVPACLLRRRMVLMLNNLGTG